MVAPGSWDRQVVLGRAPRKMLLRCVGRRMLNLALWMFVEKGSTVRTLFVGCWTVGDVLLQHCFEARDTIPLVDVRYKAGF